MIPQIIKQKGDLLRWYGHVKELGKNNSKKVNEVRSRIMEQTSHNRLSNVTGQSGKRMSRGERSWCRREDGAEQKEIGEKLLEVSGETI